MGDLVRVAKTLRTEHGFRGYIHLKTIPGASAGSDRRGGPLCRPPVDECRAPERDVACRLCAGEKRDRHQERAGGDARLDRERNGSRRARAGRIGRAVPPRFAPAGQSTQIIVGADAHRRHRHPRCQRVALRLLRAQARLLRGLQPDRPSVRAAAAGGDAAHARAPPVPGRLADALLRLQPARPRRRRALRHAQRSTSIPSSPGRSSTARNSRSTSTAPAARCCCGCRDWASARSTASSRRDAAGRCGSTTSRGCRARSRATRPFIVTLDWRPGALLDDAHLAPQARTQAAAADAVRVTACTPCGWLATRTRRNSARRRGAASRCDLSPREVAFIAADQPSLFPPLPDGEPRARLQRAARLRRTAARRDLPSRDRPLRAAL